MLSVIERRSLNSEILLAIERGTHVLEGEIPRTKHLISSEVQVSLWEGLSGKWIDHQPTKKIIKDILLARTLGRDVRL